MVPISIIGIVGSIVIATMGPEHAGGVWSWAIGISFLACIPGFVYARWVDRQNTRQGREQGKQERAFGELEKKLDSRERKLLEHETRWLHAEPWCRLHLHGKSTPVKTLTVNVMNRSSTVLEVTEIGVDNHEGTNLLKGPYPRRIASGADENMEINIPGELFVGAIQLYVKSMEHPQALTDALSKVTFV